MMPWWIILLFVVIGGFSIWMAIFLCKIDSENWDRRMNAPRFIIKPSYDLGFDIWEKELWPLPGHAPMMFYRPLFGHYKTREEAEAQLAHYNEATDETSK
jgi:hypothetical protein